MGIIRILSGLGAYSFPKHQNLKFEPARTNPPDYVLFSSGSTKSTRMTGAEAGAARMTMQKE